MVEISPIDLTSLEWALKPGEGQAAVLACQGAAFYTNVLVDAASLMRAFPGATAQTSLDSAVKDMKAVILEVAAIAVKPGMRASERNNAIREAVRARGLVPPSETAIKDALKGTEYIRSRRKRTS
jgi:hypothetical protein